MQRQRILEVHRDPGLSQAEKMARIREIMHPASAAETIEPPALPEECPHYQRGCRLICNACDQSVCCRLCHPHIDRFAVTLVECNAPRCHSRQPAQPASGRSACGNAECGNVLGEYYCAVCHMYNNDETRPMFHCDDCGYCIGGVKELYPHCNGCGIHNHRSTPHECKTFSYAAGDGAIQDCPVCRDPLKGSEMTRRTSILACGHVLHADCFRQLLQSDYRCPGCKRSAVDMTARWKQLDMRLALAGPVALLTRADTGETEELPEELRTKVMHVLCNDCGHRFARLFSPYNLYKCGGEDGRGCGSYNTSL